MGLVLQLIPLLAKSGIQELLFSCTNPSKLIWIEVETVTNTEITSIVCTFVVTDRLWSDNEFSMLWIIPKFIFFSIKTSHHFCRQFITSRSLLGVSDCLPHYFQSLTFPEGIFPPSNWNFKFSLPKFWNSTYITAKQLFWVIGLGPNYLPPILLLLETFFKNASIIMSICYFVVLLTYSSVLHLYLL